jgi:Doubled CXXCH motif (Paired_CXXCH_1)
VRISKTMMKVAMVIGLVAIALFALGLPAFAADGPTPPKIGDPVGSNVSPHGGYSSLTDYCLQCHQVHSTTFPSTDLAGEYALMAQLSVNATCNTCHGIGSGGLSSTPTGARDPGFAGTEGTVSTRAVYTEASVHTLGATSGPGSPYMQSGWSYGWTFRSFTPGIGPGPFGPSTQPAGVGTATSSSGGLYCGSCHSAHGEFGQVVDSKWVYTTADQAGGSSAVASAVVPWQNDSRIWWKDPSDTTGETWTQMYLHDAGTYWQLCTGTGGSGTCVPAQVLDAEGQLVSLFGYKLLTSSPNHLYPVYPYTGPGGRPPGGLYSDAPITGGVLAGAVAATGSPINITVTESYTGTFPSPPFHIQIGSEKLLVTGRAPGTPATYTVSRPVDGTTAAAHNAGDTVLILSGTQRYSIRSYNTDQYNHDGMLWCGSCHRTQVDAAFGGQYHNHPTGCDACHGNDAAGDADFPHSSSSQMMLRAIPDALCLECHTAGSLP